MKQKRPQSGWFALAGLAALPLFGCGADPADQGSTEPLGVIQSEILNGTTVASAGIHVYLLEPTGAGTYYPCSGTLLTDRWILTAKHCEMTTAGSLSRGSDTRGIAQVVNHPSLDIALVQASSAFPNTYTTSMYPWAPSNLVNQQVTCYGYGSNQLGGAGAGTLRSGALRVSAADSQYLTLVAANSNNQMPFYGDSGGACLLGTTSPAIIGVLSGGNNNGGINVAPTEDYYVPTSSFSQWALPIVAGSSERIACLGRECVTNPVPLPHNLWVEKAWRPCPDQLTGPGGYTFSFEAQYSFETNYDYLLVNGEWRTGSGTYSGTSTASHLGHQLQVWTDYSVASSGVSWLRARCPGDP